MQCGEEVSLNATDQAMIVIRRPGDWAGRSLRSFIVRIDGRRAGKIKRGLSGEFAVEPGEHTVAVSMDWIRSRPFQLVVEPGSRTELAIVARSSGAWKMFLPIVLAVFIAQVLVEALRTTWGIADDSWWVRLALFFAAYFVLIAGYILAAPLLVKDYWTLWTLEWAA